MSLYYHHHVVATVHIYSDADLQSALHIFS